MFLLRGQANERIERATQARTFSLLDSAGRRINHFSKKNKKQEAKLPSPEEFLLLTRLTGRK